jgi:hypothetical protein
MGNFLLFATDEPGSWYMTEKVEEIEVKRLKQQFASLLIPQENIFFLHLPQCNNRIFDLLRK